MKKLPIGAWDPRNVVIGLLSLITAASVSATLIVIHREPDPLDFAPVETDEEEMTGEDIESDTEEESSETDDE